MSETNDLLIKEFKQICISYGNQQHQIAGLMEVINQQRNKISELETISMEAEQVKRDAYLKIDSSNCIEKIIKICTDNMYKDEKELKDNDVENAVDADKYWLGKENVIKKIISCIETYPHLMEKVSK